jgi:peptidoglycan/LPS O-acetylase OafA/YrhL
MLSKGRKSFYIPELDGLRFLAFLLVFIHNAPASLPSPFFEIIHEYGWIGVDLFLCLSAFLLTRLLVHENERDGSFKFRNFYIRRILRIWPLYFFFVLLSTVITIRLTNWTPLLSLRFIGLMTFTDNIWAVWFSFNTFAFAPQLWTISYEEQFYAVLPWALRWLLKQGTRVRWIAFGVVFTLFLGLRALLIYVNAPYPAIYVLPVTHFVSILGGFMLGLGLLDKVFEKIPHWLLLLAGFIYLGVVISLPNKEVPGWHLIYTYPGLSFIFILYVMMHAKNQFWAIVLGNKPIVHLGKISFGLYVYHFFGLFLAETLRFAPQQTIWFPLIILLSGFIVTFSCAEISYRFLETPFLNLKQRFTEVPSHPV